METGTNQNNSEVTVFEANIKLAKSVRKHGCRTAAIPQQYHSKNASHQMETAFFLSDKDSARRISSLKQIQVATQVIKRTIQALERFLIFVFQKPYQPVSPASLHKLAPCLLNFRKQLSEEDVVTFLCFLKGTYGLGICYSSEYFASRLLLTMMTTLKKLPLGEPLGGKEEGKKGEGKNAGKAEDRNQINKNLFKRETETDKLNQVWNKQIELRLLTLIQENEFFLRIRDILRKEFNKYEAIITTESLKNRYYKVLRSSLKQLRILQGRVQDFPQMEHLTDNHTKFLLRSNEAHQARQRLVQFYTMPKGSQSRTTMQAKRVVEAINDCLD